ncbi:ABC transporter ATP-binding protein [Candidatus Gracilibacteria bacterium]|nr:ABC transporter ATP-binding protein [Candidatus Gracilibacteria bacterium]
MKPQSAWGVILTHLRPYRFSSIALLAAIAGAEITAALTLWQLSRLVNYMAQFTAPINELAIQSIQQQLIILFAIYITSSMLWRASGYLGAKVPSEVSKDLEYTAFTHLLKHSQSFFLDNFSGSLVKKVKGLSGGFANISNAIMWRVAPITASLISMLIMISLRQIWISIGIMLGIGTAVAINIMFFYRKRIYERRRTYKDSEITGRLSDVVTNQINVKMFGTEQQESTHFFNLLQERTQLSQKAMLIGEQSFFIQNFIYLIADVIVMWYALHLWLNGTLQLGDFLLINTYLFSLISKFFDIGKIVRDIQVGVADTQEMVDILNLPADIQDTPGASPLIVTKGAINFDQVSFSYHEREVLNDFSLSIKPGEKIALVGPSGAGKSTVVKLLLRLYNIHQGTIHIDAQNIATVTQKSLWEAVSLVPQDPVLFHRSLLENITYGTNATFDEVVAATKKAHCHEFISQLTHQYETYVGERGVKLSGGERQRVAIARAILKNAPILVLDEATSSLDSESESMIQSALRNLMKEKTAIVIAHRLSTIMQMDRILVIDQGRLVDSGTHEELLAKDSLYKKLWKIQAGGFVQ